jgi:hypothetical protein
MGVRCLLWGEPGGGRGGVSFDSVTPRRHDLAQGGLRRPQISVAGVRRLRPMTMVSCSVWVIQSSIGRQTRRCAGCSVRDEPLFHLLPACWEASFPLSRGLPPALLSWQRAGWLELVSYGGIGSGQEHESRFTTPRANTGSPGTPASDHPIAPTAGAMGWSGRRVSRVIPPGVGNL